MRARVKRFTSLAAAFLLAFLPLLLFAMPVKAAKRATLQLVKTTVYVGEDVAHWSNTQCTHEYAATELVHTDHYEKHYYNDGRLVETGNGTVTCSAPPATVRAGDTITFTLTAEITDYWYETVNLVDSFRIHGSIEKPDGFAAGQGVYALASPVSDTYVLSNTAQGEVKIHEDADFCRITFYGCNSATVWEYEAVDGGEATEPATRPTRPGRRQDVVTEAADRPGEDAGTSIISDIIDGIDEDDIGPGAAVGLAGAAAAAGAVGAAAGGGSGGGPKDTSPGDGAGEKTEKKDDRRPRSYKMYVYKNFGDAIARGAKPVYVHARIAQIIDGKEYDCPEQTAKIFPSGKGLSVRSAGVSGRWMGAEVSAPASTDAAQGSVIFSLTGAGGTFTQEVVFRLVGEPRIVFPRDLEDGRWDIAADLSLVEMIAGAGGSDRLRFAFADCAEEPKAIRFVSADGFVIRAEKDPKLAYTYYACIDNRTPPAVRENGVFAEKTFREITIEADFTDWGTIRGYFTIDLYPFGLSVLTKGGPNPLRAATPGVRQVLKDGRLEVISYLTRDPDKLTLDPLIRPTGFDLCYTRLNEDGTALIGKEPKYFRLGKLAYTSEATRNILAKYRCEIGWRSPGFSFSPQDSLPEMKGEYVVYLPVSASEDPQVNMRIPVRLLGQPFDPKADWDKEFRELCVTAIRYYPGDVAHRYVQYIRENFSDPDLWDRSELRAMRYGVIRSAQDFWTREYASQMRLIDYYDATEAIFKKPMRFIGDTFFSIWAKYMFGENESWISPLKDLVVNIVDEAIWNYAFTGKTDIDFMEHVCAMATSTLENYISIADDSGKGIVLDFKSKDTKKLAVVLSLYLLADWFSNYYQMDPKDFFESLRKTCADTSVMAVKKLVGAGFTKAMNSEPVKRFFKLSFWDYINKNLPGQARISMTKIGPDGKEIVTQKVVAGNLDKAVLNEGVQTVFVGEGSRISPDQLVPAEEARKMLAAPGMPSEFFENLRIDSLLNYRGLVQAVLDALFGQGITLLHEATEWDSNREGYGNITIPIYWPSGHKDEIVIRLHALFNGVTGLSSRAFAYLYDLFFGWYKVPRLGSPSDDVAKEILKK